MTWREVKGHEGNYQVSDAGKVRSVNRVITDTTGRVRRLKGKELAQALNPAGYVTVSISQMGRKTTRCVHQLVCEAFIGPRPPNLQVLHGPKGQVVNSVDNLNYGTPSQNALDRARDGTQHDVSRAVRREDGLLFSSVTQAAEFSGTTPGNISSVCRGKRKTTGGFSWTYQQARPL